MKTFEVEVLKALLRVIDDLNPGPEPISVDVELDTDDADPAYGFLDRKLCMSALVPVSPSTTWW
jgi:hypothetical protein